MANLETNSELLANQIKGATSEMSPDAQKQLLLQRAKLMGLSVSPNIGLDTLRAKVNAALDADSISALGETDEVPGRRPEAPEAMVAEPVVQKPETENQKRARLVREANKLVRIRITCMNPNKKDLPGEIFTVGNEYIGTVKKFIPFTDQPDGYHVPHCLYEELKNRKYLHIQTKPNKRDSTTPMVSTRDMPEFAIEVLAPLTERELNALAQRQAMAAGTVTAEVDQ